MAKSSREAAQAIIVVDQLENVYRRFDQGEEMEEEIEVLTVRYKHALRRLQATNPDELPELVLEPQLANEQNSMPCPYGFGRLVWRPWALQLRSLGFCDRECMCDALLRARDDVVVMSGVGWDWSPKPPGVWP